MIKNYLQVLDYQTLIIVLLSLASTYICLELEIIVEMPTGLVGIAIVFPIVFSINAAYRRREEALSYLANLKAAAISLYYAHRDWLPEENNEHAKRIKQLAVSLFQEIRDEFSKPSKEEKNFQNIYSLFSDISGSVELLRAAGVSPPELSRIHDYVKTIITEFENLRNIAIYRTPLSLRAYTQVFLNAFPIIFGPYFAFLSSNYFVASGFLIAVFYSVVLVSLDNIQDDLENPYDGIGADDISLDLAEDYIKLV